MIFYNKFILKLFALLILLVSIFYCTKSIDQSNSASADFHYNRGLELLKSDDPENAEREFRFAIELDDQFAPAYLGLATLNYNKKDYSTSGYYIDEAIKLKKHWVDTYLLKGKILFKKEKYDQALDILNKADDIIKNGNGNNRINLKSEIFLYRGLCLKNMGSYELAAIEFAAAQKLDPDNLIASQAMQDIRQITEMTAAYPSSIKNIIIKKSISRADWAELLMNGLLTHYLSKIPVQIPEKNIVLPDIGSNKTIVQAVKRNLVNVYPDGEYKPDLDLSWAEVIISAKNILQSKIKKIKQTELKKPPFSDLPNLHPLYDSAALAESFGVFNNLSQESYNLSQSVKGMDALHVIINLDKILDRF